MHEDIDLYLQVTNTCVCDKYVYIIIYIYIHVKNVHIYTYIYTRIFNDYMVWNCRSIADRNNMIYLYVHRTFDFHIVDITRYTTFLSYIVYIGCIYIYIYVYIF